MHILFVLSLCLSSEKSQWLTEIMPVAKQIKDIPYQVTVSQAALESGWGTVTPGNNYFGLKGNLVDGSSGIRKYGYLKYENMNESIASYARAIRKYDCDCAENPVDFSICVWSKGYASDARYIPRLVGVMHRIYKETGDKSFDVRLTKRQKSYIRNRGLKSWLATHHLLT